MEELIIKAKNGNNDAFIEAITLIQKDLFNIAYLKLNNIDDANDAIQETMLIAFKNIKRLKEPHFFKTWIIKILINECNKSFKKQHKQSELFKKILKTKDTHSIDHCIENINSQMDYDILISKLTSKEQNVLILYFSNDFTMQEIATILNTNINTVKTRLRRAQEKIKTNSNGEKYGK